MAILLLVVAVVAGLEYVRRSIAELREGQRVIKQELERLTNAAGLAPRQAAMVRCPRCLNFYAPDFTGCPVCGAVKPAGAATILISASAVDPDRHTAPAAAE